MDVTERGIDLAAQLRSAGRVLGLDVSVTDAEEWELGPTHATVGLGFFRSRGYSDADTAALVLRDFWAGVRVPRLAPARAYRRDAVAARSPELAPLLAVIDRAHAGAELCAAMPGVRRPLDAATLRGVPEELRERGLEEQWCGALLRVSAGAATVRVDEPVRAELARLLGGAPGHVPPGVLQRVLGLEPGITPGARFDRALAVLVPPLQRLRARAGRGIADGRGETAGSDTAGADGAELGLGHGAAAGDADGADGAEAADAADTIADTGEADAPDTAAASDPGPVDTASLTESRSETPPVSLIDVPLPARASGALTEPPGIAAGEPAERTPGGAGSAPGPSRGLAQASLAEYRARVGRWAPEIARVREVWRSVLAPGQRERRVLSRRPAAEGVVLHRERLAATVTEIRAGVPRPPAFRTRARRARDAEGLGRIDTMLVLDRSASMGGAASEACADAALVLLEALAAVARDIARVEQQHAIALGTALRSGLIVFDDVPRVVAPLSRAVAEGTRASLVASVRSASGRTDTAEALRVAGAELGVILGEVPETRPGRDVARRRLLVLVGDGECEDPAELAAVVAQLRARGVEVCGIGIGSAPGMSLLGAGVRRIASARELPAALGAMLAAVPVPVPVPGD